MSITIRIVLMHLEPSLPHGADVKLTRILMLYCFCFPLPEYFLYDLSHL